MDAIRAVDRGRTVAWSVIVAAIGSCRARDAMAANLKFVAPLELGLGIPVGESRLSYTRNSHD